MIDQLTRKIRELRAPVVVGLDPNTDFIPWTMKGEAYGRYGQTLKGAAAALWAFNKEIIDHI